MREGPRPVARLGAFLAQVPLLPDDLDRDRLRLSAADGVGAREPRDDPVRPGVVQLRQPHGDLAVVAGRQAGRLLVPAHAPLPGSGVGKRADFWCRPTRTTTLPRTCVTKRLETLTCTLPRLPTAIR